VLAGTCGGGGSLRRQRKDSWSAESEPCLNVGPIEGGTAFGQETGRLIGAGMVDQGAPGCSLTGSSNTGTA
jgi:hypothetical protein